MAKRASGKKPSSSRGSPPPAATLHIWQIQAVRDVLVVAAVVAVVWTGYALRAVTVPLLVALLLAYLFEPVVANLSARPRMNRVRAVAGVLGTVGLAVVIVLAIALPLIVGQSARFVSDVGDGTMRSRIAQLGSYVPEPYSGEFDSLLDLLPGDAVRADEGGGSAAGAKATNARPEGAEVDDAAPIGAPAAGEDGAARTDDATAALTADEVRAVVDRRIDERLRPGERGGRSGAPSAWGGLLRGGTQAVVKGVAMIVQAALVAFLIPFYFFFFSLWNRDVVEFLRKFIPERDRDRWLELLGKMDAVVAGFVRGRIVISLIVGAMLAVGWLFCGVPYAVALGLVIGVFFLVPYLGGVGVPLAVGLLAIEYLGTSVDERGIWLGWWGVVLWPTLVFVLVQIAEGWVLTPAIAGKATNLDPVTIIVAVLAGGSVLGVYGMLLAIPLAACGKILFAELLLPRIRAWTKGEARDPLPIGEE